MAMVLLVDDDTAFRSTTRRLLERLGHVVREAADGRAAREAMRADPADVVLMDVYMAGEDGIEATRRLAAEFPGARVVVMSGGGALPTELTLALARSLGALAVLAKPFSRDELSRALDQVLAHGAGDAA